MEGVIRTMRPNRFNEDNCPQHERLVKILTNAYRAGVDIELAFAEVQEKIRKRRWIARGLRESRARHLDLNALVGKKSDASHSLVPLGDDHSSIWLDEHRNAVRYVFQPYGLSHGQILVNVELCDQLGLEMHIRAAKSWHCAGKTLLVEFRKPASVDRARQEGGVTK